MAVTIKNITVEQGASFVDYVQLVDNSKNPVNVTGWNLYGQVQKSYNSANVTTSFTVFALNQSNISISLDANVTALIPAGRYVYNIFGSRGQRVEKINEGVLTVNPSTIATGLHFNGYAGNTVPDFIRTYVNDRISSDTYDIRYGLSYVGTTQIEQGNTLYLLSGQLGNTSSDISVLRSNISSIENNFVSNTYLNSFVTTLKTLVSSSNSWEEFQANIALL
jgi:hypothetical protein